MNSLFRALGMAMRAGKLVSGDEQVLKAVRSGEAKLVVLATDASDNTKKKCTDKCTHYRVEVLEASDRLSLGQCIGKSERAVLAVTEDGFAGWIKKSISEAVPREVESIEQTRQ